jgi:hypothetical protein
MAVITAISDFSLALRTEQNPQVLMNELPKISSHTRKKKSSVRIIIILTLLLVFAGAAGT